MQQIQEYGAWRAAIADALATYRGALQAAELADAATMARIHQAQARVRDDRLSVAFVAEFSRGKSELINAIFFADYGQRILPSAAGRTTMCPTELLYDAAFEPCIRLLPIETRASTLSTGDYRDDPAAWTVLPLDLDNPERMREAFRQVSLTRRVPAEEARRYGLFDPQDPEHADACAADGTVEIPQWRHALINLPHPLLKQGLVILDTPGLNAIGTEPELTLNLIPNAHAVLFVLAAETGVTRSDIEVWRTHIGAGPGRIVVLNKIDAMWDPLKNEADNEAELARQPEQDLAPAARILHLRQLHHLCSLNHSARFFLSNHLYMLVQGACKSMHNGNFNNFNACFHTYLLSQLRNDHCSVTSTVRPGKSIYANLRALVQYSFQLCNSQACPGVDLISHKSIFQ